MNFDKISVGEHISYTDYLTVKSINKADGSIVVKNTSGNEMTVRGKTLIEGMHSGNQFSTTEKLSRTAIIEKLEQAGDKVFTVVFLKADSSERTLTGHLLAVEPKMGRSSVRDLNIQSGNPIRLVDHRTIMSLIFDNVKYVAK